MYRFWNSIIEPAFHTFHPQVIVEIGVAQGLQTLQLLDYCKAHNTVLHGIDTVRPSSLSVWEQSYGTHWRFHQDMSLNALGQIQGPDAVLIDGDHNWYTVFHELLILEKGAAVTGKFPVVFLHDLDWPYGRRDLYYAPERIPAAYRKAHMAKGMVQGQGMLAEQGGVNPHLQHAVEENNLQNGVLTAVEDFLAQSTVQLRFVHIPGLHGLGIIASQDTLDTYPDLSAFLHTLSIGPSMRTHIDTLEKERVQFFEELMPVAELKTTLDETIRTNSRLYEEIDSHAQKETQLLESLKSAQEDREIVLQTLKTLQKENATLTEKLRKTKTAYEYVAAQKVEPLPGSSPSLRLLKRVWVSMGEPFPGFTRYVRHTLLQRMFPAQHDQSVKSRTQPSSQPLSADLHLPSAAALIICTKTDAHLEQAINSVLVQSILPREIVVLDTTGSKIIADICDKMAEQTIRLVTTDPLHILETGVRITESPVLLFLDADAVLHPEYLRAGVRRLAERTDADMTYTNQQFFGSNKDKREVPEEWTLQNMEQYEPAFMAWIAKRSSCLARLDGSKPAEKWVGVRNNGVYFHRIDPSSPLSR